jgi:hypothetical protein
MPLLESRIIHWMNYRYKASGYLHWGWNQWNEDPYEDPGEHCGDAWLVNPVAGGVVNSLRWEQMRNGIQDYEYFWLLENRFSELKDSLGSRFSWIDPHIRGSEIAGRVVPGLTSFTKDPEIIYNARLEILNELISLDTYPRAILQTDPEENSLLTNHSSVAVLGWTDFGTRIFVNGQEVPVSENGMFMEQFTLDIDYQEENPEFILRITASTSSAEKVIIRRFNVRN